MKISATNERMVYNVQSRSKPTEFHRVDLLAHLGRGECSCTDWQTRRWPIIKKREPEVRYGEPGSSLCRHVAAARDYFLQTLLKQMASEEQK